jgi:hypothetical protein
MVGSAWTSVAGCGETASAAGDAGAEAGDASNDDATSDGGTGEASVIYEASDDGDGGAFDGASCQVLTCPGECVRGRCLFLVAQGGAFDLTVRSSVVYWTNPGSTPSSGSVLGISSIPSASSGGPEVYGASQKTPYGIAVNATTLFWASDETTNGKLLSVPLAPPALGSGVDGGDGGAPRAITEVATGQLSPNGVAIDDKNVYWTTSGAPNASNGTVVMAPLAGGAPITLATGRRSPVALAVDATTVYWVDAGFGVSDGAVLKVPISGGRVITLAGGQNGPIAVAVDGANVYWTRAGPGDSSAQNGSIVRVAIEGGDFITLASGQLPLRGLAVDSTAAYWTVSRGEGTGAVLTRDLAGGAIDTLVSGLNFPLDLATDSTSLYWTDTQAGTISKLTPK